VKHTSRMSSVTILVVCIDICSDVPSALFQQDEHYLSPLIGERFHGLIGSLLNHRSLPPEFESLLGHISRVFHLLLCFITFIVTSVCVCVLAVYNKAQAQIVWNREFKLWTFLQGTEYRVATFHAETCVMSHQCVRALY